MLNSCVVQTYNEEEELRRKFPQYFKKHCRANIHIVTGKIKMGCKNVGYLNDIGCQLRDILPPHFFDAAVTWYCRILKE